MMKLRIVTILFAFLSILVYAQNLTFKSKADVEVRLESSLDLRTAGEVFNFKPNDNSNAHFSAFASKDQISLHWLPLCPAEDLGGYKIMRAEEEAGDYVLINSYECNPRLSHQSPLAKNPHFYFTDLAVVPGITYWYKLICIYENENSILEFGPISASLPIHQIFSSAAFPKTLKIESLHKNPDQSISSFQLQIPDDAESHYPTRIAIYSSRGEQVKTLYKGMIEAGSYQFIWNGDSEQGDMVRPGIFYAVFENENVREAAKLILMK